jgi:hypothetical protein
MRTKIYGKNSGSDGLVSVIVQAEREQRDKGRIEIIS